MRYQKFFALRFEPGRHARQPPRRKAETLRVADGLQIGGKRRPRRTECKRRQRGQ